MRFLRELFRSPEPIVDEEYSRALKAIERLTGVVRVVATVAPVPQEIVDDWNFAQDQGSKLSRREARKILEALKRIHDRDRGAFARSATHVEGEPIAEWLQHQGALTSLQAKYLLEEDAARVNA